MIQAGPHSKEPAVGVLAAPRRPVARYRPWIMAGLVGLVLLAVGFALLFAFSPRRLRQAPPEEPPAAPAAPQSEIDRKLPASYDDPLAIGRVAQTAAASGGAPEEHAAEPASAGPSPEQVEHLQLQRAARISGPFFSGAGAPASRTAASGVHEPGTDLTPPQRMPPPSVGAAEAGRERPRLARPALFRYEVKAGSIIPAALVTGLNSDLPGPVIAQVTEPVFDHLTGSHVLIAQGSRLLGRYDSQAGYGQDRMLVVWTQIILPDGRSLDLGAMAGADVTGASGLADEVDTHAPALFRAIGLSSLITIGAAAAQNALARSADNLILQDASGGLSAAASQSGQQVVERDLTRPPTLRVRPGWPLRIIVEQDLVLSP